MFHLIFSVPALYALARFVAPLPWPLAARVALGVALLVASQYHLWCRLSSGSVFAPEFGRPLILLFNWAFGAIVLLALFQLVLDLGALVLAATRGGSGARAGAGVATGARYAIGGAAALLAAVGVAQAVRVPPVRDLTVAVPGLPAAFDGYRLVQLTDLHLSRLFPEPWARAVVDRTNAAGADLIVVTGDFIDGAVASRRRDVAPLAGLRAADGVWFVPGNHEYFFSYADWMRHLAGLGLRPLLNAHHLLRRGDDALVLAGVTDLSAAAAGAAPPDLAAALAGAPRGAPVVLLDHQPRAARAAAARGVALQLSGHTHGGMIRGLDRIVARANDGFVSGRYAVGAMTLYVSNGTGLWPGFALRLGPQSEITRITLRPAP